MTEVETRLNAALPVEGTLIEGTPAIDLKPQIRTCKAAYVESKFPFAGKTNPLESTSGRHYLGRKVNVKMESTLSELEALTNAWYSSNIDDDSFIQGALHLLTKKRELEKKN
ncbi:MAG: hypothetical protein NO516_06165 [Candidatus Methanomethylicia archaeon]|nr:hypothetical protein [Candidatus Methanomethylicia archaeon]